MSSDPMVSSPRTRASRSPSSLSARPFRLLPFLATFAITFAILSACGGDGQSDATPSMEGAGDTPGAETAPTEVGAEGVREVSREDFVLCSAIEPVADTLASLAGFTLEGGVQTGTSECRLQGGSGGFVMVALAPAVMPSVQEMAAGYAAEASSVPDLGEGALVVASDTQPHVIFELLGQIVDVGMENFNSPPTPETVVEAGTIVRDALLAASGGG